MTKLNQLDQKPGADPSKGPKSSDFEDIFNKFIDNIIDESEKVVDIITFSESPYYLKQPLHPVQRFILKSFYHIPFDDTNRDILVRSFPHDEKGRFFTEVEYCRFLTQQERSNVESDMNSQLSQELLLACGRRGGKTFIASIISCYEAYKLIIKENPQAYYKMAEGEPIKILNVASAGDQALVLAAAINNRIMECEWFRKYISSFNSEEVNLRTRHDIDKMESEKRQFGKPLKERASIKIQSLLCSARSVRGGSAIVAVLDEIAHFVDNEGNRGGKAIYDSLTPSLATFGRDGKIICISSPGTKSGIFYDLYVRSKNNFSITMLQIPTWEMNPTVDWGFLNDRFDREPEVFWTEYGAKFTTTISGFFKFPEKIRECIDVLEWKEEYDEAGNKLNVPIYREESLYQNGRHKYYIALDPALSDNGYAMCMAHLERDDNMRPIVVIDQWKKWSVDDPEFENYDFIDIEFIDNYVLGLTRNFKVSMIAYDQFESGASIQKFIKMGINAVRTRFTRAYNMTIYKTLRAAIYDKRVSLLFNEDGINELIHLQEKKINKREFKVQAALSGDVTTDDMADVLANVVQIVLENEMTGAQITSASIGDFGHGQVVTGKIESQRDYMLRQRQHKYLDKFSEHRRLNSFRSLRRGPR